MAELLLISPDGTWQTKLLDVHSWCEPTWPPDGSEIAFGNECNLVAIILRRNQTRIIVSGEKIANQFVVNVRWLIDGKYLTFFNRMGSDVNDESGWTIWTTFPDVESKMNIPFRLQIQKVLKSSKELDSCLTPFMNFWTNNLGSGIQRRFLSHTDLYKCV